jgi:3-methyladenine DNA glycosylase Tag
MVSGVCRPTTTENDVRRLLGDEGIVRNRLKVRAAIENARAMLRERGFRFVGSTIVYAFMQACGLVDDHVRGCFRAKRR